MDADLARCAELVEAVARAHDDLADAAVVQARSHRALAVLSRDIASFLRGGGLSEPLDLLHGGLGLVCIVYANHSGPRRGSSDWARAMVFSICATTS